MGFAYQQYLFDLTDEPIGYAQRDELVTHVTGQFPALIAEHESHIVVAYDDNKRVLGYRVLSIDGERVNTAVEGEDQLVEFLRELNSTHFTFLHNHHTGEHNRGDAEFVARTAEIADEYGLNFHGMLFFSRTSAGILKAKRIDVGDRGMAHLPPDVREKIIDDWSKAFQLTPEGRTHLAAFISFDPSDAEPEVTTALLAEHLSPLVDELEVRFGDHPLVHSLRKMANHFAASTGNILPFNPTSNPFALPFNPPTDRIH